MKDNKFLIIYCNIPESYGTSFPRWDECLIHQCNIIEWCKENIDPEEGFPRWQMMSSGNKFCIPDVTADYESHVVFLHEGVYIFNEDDRTAFTLKFGYIDWDKPA